VQRISPLQLGKPADLVAEIEAGREDVLLVGDGALRYADELASARGVELAEQWLAHPSAAPLVQLAHAKALREEWVNSWELSPLYLRKPDAEINWITRDSR
jgi:tRNA threonylcarbamoyladenosine biosynthesis protein TsaB